MRNARTLELAQAGRIAVLKERRCTAKSSANDPSYTLNHQLVFIVVPLRDLRKGCEVLLGRHQKMPHFDRIKGWKDIELRCSIEQACW